MTSDEGRKELVETLERHLKDFLVADWQKRGQTDKGAEELAAEIQRRVA